MWRRELIHVSVHVLKQEQGEVLCSREKGACPSATLNSFLRRLAGRSSSLSEDLVFAVDCGVKRFSSGQVFVIWMPIDGPVVRRAFIDLGKLILKSDNQAYPDISIPLNEIPEDGFILGRVM